MNDTSNVLVVIDSAKLLAKLLNESVEAKAKSVKIYISDDVEGVDADNNPNEDDLKKPDLVSDHGPIASPSPQEIEAFFLMTHLWWICCLNCSQKC